MRSLRSQRTNRNSIWWYLEKIIKITLFHFPHLPFIFIYTHLPLLTSIYLCFTLRHTELRVPSYGCLRRVSDGSRATSLRRLSDGYDGCLLPVVLLPVVRNWVPFLGEPSSGWIRRGLCFCVVCFFFVQFWSKSKKSRFWARIRMQILGVRVFFSQTMKSLVLQQIWNTFIVPFGPPSEQNCLSIVKFGQ